MSQAHGRHSGSRDNGPRQTRPSNPTSRRQNKPFAKGSPARDPAQTASIFKTRSFKLLVDAVGAENIALGLDSNLTRVSELVNGVGFTPETAFHIETTLGLPDGFFDQPSPVLTPAIIARLKSPLDFMHAHVEPEPAYPELAKPALLTNTSQSATSSDRLPKEPEMPKKTSGGSPRAGATNMNKPMARPAVGASPKTIPANAKTPSKSSPQQSLPLTDDAAVERIRRANLHVLTSRNGSKARLGTLMEISGSNMAHRLHGQKRLDDAEANRFTERLGLPTGWLDVPRIVPDIPASVATLLLPASRRHAAAQENVRPVPEPKIAAAGNPAAGKVRAMRGRPTSRAEANQERVQATDTADPDSGNLSKQEQAMPSSTGIAMRQDNDVLAAAVRPQLAPSASLQPRDELRPLALASSLDNLQGIQPIAEALLKTLAGKARTGRLDEAKALELLQQAVLL